MNADEKSLSDHRGPDGQQAPDGLAREWPSAADFRKSIRLEFTLYVSAIILVLMAITGYVISSQYVKTVSHGIVDKLLVQARSYSGPAGKLMIAESGPDALLLNNICKRMAGDNPDVFWAGIAGTDGVFLAHTDLGQVVASRRLGPVGDQRFSEMLRAGEGLAIRGDTICIAVPVYENDLALGSLAVAASSSPIRKARTASILTVASITVAMMLVGAPATIWLLRRKLRPIGVITDHLKRVKFDDISLDIPFTSSNEFGFLAETIRVMGRRLKLAQREIVEKERMSRELEIAHELQAGMLPKAYPKGTRFELAGAYTSAKEVGGDYYDFIEYDDGRLGILIADVSGKSLPGMLFMLLTRDIVKTLARSFADPADLLCQLNRQLLGDMRKGMFVTMAFGILDRESGTFAFASSGHNPLVVVRGATGAVEQIKTKGFPLGMVGPEAYRQRLESREIALGPDDWVVLYTDGVNEAKNRLGEEFGMDRFIDMIGPRRAVSADRLVTDVLAGLKEFVGEAVQYDDITLLALKWTGEPADTKSMPATESMNVA